MQQLLHNWTCLWESVEAAWRGRPRLRKSFLHDVQKVRIPEMTAILIGPYLLATEVAPKWTSGASKSVTIVNWWVALLIAT